MTERKNEDVPDLAPEMKVYLEQLRMKNRVIERAGTRTAVTMPLMAGGKTSAQPAGMKALSGLTLTGSKFFASHGKFQAHGALIGETMRLYDKNQAAIQKIKFQEVEEPGVIPRTLAMVETILGRVNTEEQPRIEGIMDEVKGNLAESRGILGHVNDVVGAVTGFFGSHQTLTLIALGITALWFIIVAILIPIVLIRIIFFGL
jgi:hypothetical protein